MVDAAGISRWRAWVLAARPKTLPAAVAPVLVGSAAAVAEGAFQPVAAAVALLCALLIQIGTNFANDYFDFIKGADSGDRLGPVRVVTAGIIPARTVRTAMAVVFGAAFLLGLWLVRIGGWPILAIGIASIVSAVMYTAGPWSIAYNGLGDVFAFLFFGPVAVVGTYYVQALHVSTTAMLASIPVGAIVTAILVVNNHRDIDTDRAAGKRTLAVRIGRTATRWEYAALLAAAYVVPLAQAVAAARWQGGLVVLSLPPAVRLIRTIFTSTDGPTLNHALGATGRFLALFSLLHAVGMVI